MFLASAITKKPLLPNRRSCLQLAVATLGQRGHLNAFETGSEARRGIGHWINLYNSKRPHSAHNGATPEEAYTGLDKTGGNKNYGVHLRNAAEWSSRWGPPLGAHTG